MMNSFVGWLGHLRRVFSHSSLRGVALAGLRAGLGVGLGVGLGIGIAAHAGAKDLSSLEVHPALRISTFAKIPGARSLAVAEEIRTVFVGTRSRFLYAIHDGKRYLLADDLNVANGIAWRAPNLYVAEQNRVTLYRLPAFAPTLPEGSVLFDQLPNRQHHGWRYVTVDDGGDLYVSVGVSCNVCITDSIYEGTILRLAPFPGREPQIYASGIRNSVGLDFHPVTGDLWFTDNGVDYMGDNNPPDELNRARRAGLHFGFPWFAGGNVRSFPFADQEVPIDVELPVAHFGAHTAPLGVHFYRSDKIKLFVGGALVALHGSWNRTVPDGYRVELLHFDAQGEAITQEPILAGFRQLRGKGRPVDVKTYWDGSILISDDSRGAVYRVQSSRFQ